MKIKTIPISQIKPAAYNPRIDLQPGDPEYEKIKRSIDEFDLVEPLVWNEATGNLIGGHQRLKILVEKGIQETEVSIVNIPDINREKALNIALNKATGSFDFPKVHEILSEMKNDDFDFTLTGFTMDDLTGFDSEFMVEKDGLTDADAVPEPPKVAKTKPGDLYILGEHRLLCGDSTSREDVERLMDGRNADLVFTDPPYGIDVVGDDGNIGGGTKHAPTTKFMKVRGDEKEFNPSFVLPYAEKVFIWGGEFFCSSFTQRWTLVCLGQESSRGIYPVGLRTSLEQY